MIVVDASVLTDFLLGRPSTVDALALEFEGDEEQPLHAPELIEPETLNALRRFVRSGEVSEERATAVVSDLAHVRLVRYPHGPLRGRIWELRDELTAYDAAYLTLAEALDEPVLLTGDSGLAVRARESLGGGRVRHIA